MATNVELEETAAEVDGGFAPGMPEPRSADDILREQLDYLIDHASGQGICGCSQCQRYLRVRAALLEIFDDPEMPHAREVVQGLLKAA